MTEVISGRIADGTYPPGSRVPGIVELGAEFEIAASTAQKAFAHLRDTGQVSTELGLGTRRLEVGRLTPTTAEGREFGRFAQRDLTTVVGDPGFFNGPSSDCHRRVEVPLSPRPVALCAVFQNCKFHLLHTEQ
ncbi:GntR family transcriptional regulator [Streptomyces sioyaensis]|uniref:GntR family transcriptional regulator n=1 Tax=Streptomyces sioyaensis TaxID=67364 RepID=UPI0037D5A82A